MKAWAQRTIVAAVLANLAAGAGAIIMRHDVAEDRYRTLGEKYRPYLAQLNVPGISAPDSPLLYNGIGTLIAPRWVITAAHAADRFPPGQPNAIDLVHHRIYINGRGYRIARAIIHPAYATGGRPNLNHDIALLQLEKDVTPERGKIACLYEGRDELNQIVTMAGTGVSGTGKTGVGRPDGALRGATIRVSGVAADRIFWKFRSPDDPLVTELEGISGPGDSGGPAFIEKDGKTCIAGISSSQDTNGGDEGLYGVTEYYTRVSSHIDWIRNVMAETPA